MLVGRQEDDRFQGNTETVLGFVSVLLESNVDVPDFELEVVYHFLGESLHHPLPLLVNLLQKVIQGGLRVLLYYLLLELYVIRVLGDGFILEL